MCSPATTCIVPCLQARSGAVCSQNTVPPAVAHLLLKPRCLFDPSASLVWTEARRIDYVGHGRAPVRVCCDRGWRSSHSASVSRRRWIFCSCSVSQGLGLVIVAAQDSILQCRCCPRWCGIPPADSLPTGGGRSRCLRWCDWRVNSELSCATSGNNSAPRFFWCGLERHDLADVVSRVSAVWLVVDCLLSHRQQQSVRDKDGLWDAANVSQLCLSAFSHLLSL